MYHYLIVRENNSYYFELYPGNNNSQPLGKSMYYSSREECISGLWLFKEIVKKEKVDSVDSVYIRYEKTDNDSYICDYLDYDNKVIFHKIYPSKNRAGMNKRAESLYKNIDAGIREK